MFPETLKTVSLHPREGLAEFPACIPDGFVSRIMVTSLAAQFAFEQLGTLLRYPIAVRELPWTLFAAALAAPAAILIEALLAWVPLRLALGPGGGAWQLVGITFVPTLWLSPLELVATLSTGDVQQVLSAYPVLALVWSALLLVYALRRHRPSGVFPAVLAYVGVQAAAMAFVAMYLRGAA